MRSQYALFTKEQGKPWERLLVSKSIGEISGHVVCALEDLEDVCIISEYDPQDETKLPAFLR